MQVFQLYKCSNNIAHLIRRGIVTCNMHIAKDQTCRGLKLCETIGDEYSSVLIRQQPLCRHAIAMAI